MIANLAFLIVIDLRFLLGFSANQFLNHLLLYVPLEECIDPRVDGRIQD